MRHRIILILYDNIKIGCKLCRHIRTEKSSNRNIALVSDILFELTIFYNIYQVSFISRIDTAFPIGNKYIFLYV